MKPISKEAIEAQAAFIRSAYQVEDDPAAMRDMEQTMVELSAPLSIHEARDIAVSLYLGSMRLVDGNGVLTPDDDLQWHISAVKQCMIELEARWQAL